jgi:hypothetical protein
MFIGGLNWETTEGMYCPTMSLVQPVAEAMTSHNFYVQIYILTYHARILEGLLLTIRRGQRMHRHARFSYWSLARIRFPYFQGP